MNEITPPVAGESSALTMAAPANDEAPIEATGLYQITHERYHADPCAIPSLSSSIAKILLRQTAKHAWQAHPRFGAVGIVPTRVMDDGSAMHAMILGHAHLIEPIRAVYGPKHKNAGKPVTDYKTDVAIEERDEIRKLGRIPVLAHRLPELIRCKGAALRQLADTEDGAVFLSPGRNEICAVSQEGDVWLRCLVDRLPDDHWLSQGDLKCTELSAAPGGWERRLQAEYAFQDAFYRRVVAGAEGGVERPPMRFGVIELDPPHGTVINAAKPELREIAEAEVERAIQIWRQCMRSGEWPCYGRETVWVGPASWQLKAAEDAEQIDPAALQARIGAPATFAAVRALRAA